MYTNHRNVYCVCRLASLSVMEELAGILGDTEVQQELSQLLTKAQNCFEEKLWNGNSFHIENKLRTLHHNFDILILVLVTIILQGEICLSADYKDNRILQDV